jgi:hypothetical protein
MNIYGCNTINSILSIRTYVNTSIILLPTILLSLLTSTLVRTFQSPYIMVSSCARLALTRLAGITFAGQIACSANSFPIARFISTKNISRSCPSFNLQAFEKQQLYEIRPYMWSIIICLFVYNTIYSSSNSSCSMVNLNLNVTVYGSFGHPFLLMKSISSSQRLSSVYAASNWFGDRG